MGRRCPSYVAETGQCLGGWRWAQVARSRRQSRTCLPRGSQLVSPMGRPPGAQARLLSPPPLPAPLGPGPRFQLILSLGGLGPRLALCQRVCALPDWTARASGTLSTGRGSPKGKESPRTSRSGGIIPVHSGLLWTCQSPGGRGPRKSWKQVWALKAQWPGPGLPGAGGPVHGGVVISPRTCGSGA